MGDRKSQIRNREKPMKTPSIPHLLKKDFYTTHGEILSRSYKELVGDDLIETETKTTNKIEAIWQAPFAVVSHGIEEDPIFNFGNKIALELFELEFNEFINLPSRRSAEEIDQSERKRLLAEVTKHGFISNYSGIRISASGKRFLIEDAIVWNLSDMKGKYCGQAAKINNWTYL